GRGLSHSLHGARLVPPAADGNDGLWQPPVDALRSTRPVLQYQPDTVLLAQHAQRPALALRPDPGPTGRRQYRADRPGIARHRLVEPVALRLHEQCGRAWSADQVLGVAPPHEAPRMALGRVVAPGLDRRCRTYRLLGSGAGKSRRQ